MTDRDTGPDGYARQAAANAQRIEKELEALKSGHWDMMIRDYKGFFAHAEAILELFKTLKPLLPKDRERLWAEYQWLRTDAKNRRQQEWDRRAANSRQKRSLVEAKIRDAHLTCAGARDRDDLHEADALLATALRYMKNDWSGFNAATDFFETLTGNDGKMLKEDHDACWQRWLEVKEEVKFKRQELADYDYWRITRSMGDVLLEARSGDPRETLRKIKEARAELKGTFLRQTQYDEINRDLNQAWETATGRLDQLRQERQERHNEWAERQEANIARWRGRIQDSEDFIDRLESQIDDLRDKESGARSEDFAERVRGWIDEKLEKIAQVRGDIRELESKIESVQNKLNG